MTNELLLPCPFCRGTDLRVFGEMTPDAWVECLDCGAEGPHPQHGPNMAIELWNKAVRGSSEPKVGETFPEGVLPDARLIRSTLFQQFMRQGFWHAHHVDLVWRMDGKDIREEADWLKDVWYALRGSAAAERASRDASSGDTSVALDGGPICEDCPPLGYPTDKTRCDECPRHSERTGE